MSICIMEIRDPDSGVRQGVICTQPQIDYLITDDHHSEKSSDESNEQGIAILSMHHRYLMEQFFIKLLGKSIIVAINIL